MKRKVIFHKKESQDSILLPTGTIKVGPSSVATTYRSTASPEKLAKELKKGAKEELFIYPSSN